MGTRKEYHKKGAEGSRGAFTDGIITVQHRAARRPSRNPAGREG